MCVVFGTTTNKRMNNFQNKTYIRHVVRLITIFMMSFKKLTYIFKYLVYLNCSLINFVIQQPKLNLKIKNPHINSLFYSTH